MPMPMVSFANDPNDPGIREVILSPRTQDLLLNSKANSVLVLVMYLHRDADKRDRVLNRESAARISTTA